MSIYATLWSIQIRDPAAAFSEPRWVEVTAQAVPPHIGSPTPGCGYEGGDPYAAFLPPPVETDDDGCAEFHRAVVFITNETHKGTERSPQEYAAPLLVLSGAEYGQLTFDELHQRLQDAIRSGPRVVAEFFGPTGQWVITEDDSDRISGRRGP
ncbi:MAG: hypothetical protein KY476_18155 [Planctomycetes bacterium]|nr:hypothetical protein [Planctomycetota bacterium]